MGPLLCSVSLVQISFTDQQFPPSSPQLQSLSALSDIHTAARVMDLKHPLLCHTHAWELSKGPPANGRAPAPPLSTAPAFACWSHIVCLALRTPNLSLSVSHVLQKTHHSVPPRPSTPSGNIYKASKYVHGDAMSVSWHLLSVFQAESSHFLNLSSDDKFLSNSRGPLLYERPVISDCPLLNEAEHRTGELFDVLLIHQ